MILDFETALGGDFDLPLLDVGVVELFYMTAFDAHDVIVMTALLEFEDRFTRLEVMPDQ